MGSFSIKYGGEIKEIWFSLIRDASWTTTSGDSGVCFEHGDDFITMLPYHIDELDEEVRDMFLQACGLVAT